MDFLKYLILILFGASLLIIIFLALKSRSFFKTLFLNAFFGLSLLAIFYLLKPYTGFYIPINEYTVILSSVLGIPSVIMFLCLNIIFI